MFCGERFDVFDQNVTGIQRKQALGLQAGEIPRYQLTDGAKLVPMRSFQCPPSPLSALDSVMDYFRIPLSPPYFQWLSLALLNHPAAQARDLPTEFLVRATIPKRDRCHSDDPAPMQKRLRRLHRGEEEPPATSGLPANRELSPALFGKPARGRCSKSDTHVMQPPLTSECRIRKMKPPESQVS